MSSVQRKKVAYLKGKTVFFLIFRGIKTEKKETGGKIAVFLYVKREKQALSPRGAKGQKTC